MMQAVSCLILLWATIFQQNSVTSEPRLLCNNATRTTVGVKPGENVTLCCTLDDPPYHTFEAKEFKCKPPSSGKCVLHRTCSCGSEEETCALSRKMSLVISNVTENQNLALEVFTTCGKTLSHSIEVQVENNTNPDPVVQLSPSTPVTAIVAGVLMLLVLGIIVVFIMVRRRSTSSQRQSFQV